MKKCFVFDFDDTLATTTAKILVWGRGSSGYEDAIVRELTPAEFSSYELKSGEEFDFSQFRDDKFIQEANPTWLMSLASEIDGEGHDIYILTAREDDSADAIAEFLSGFNVYPKMIHCVGGTRESIPKRKRDILMMLLDNYSKVYFYDDCSVNIEHAPDNPKMRKYQI